MGGIDMKAVDLMIGDWVKIKGHLDYDKVQEIARDESMQWYISFACSATLFRAYEFEPVPLTPEILEKNGFEMFKYDGWVHYYRIFGNGAIPFVLHSIIGGEMLSQEVDIFSTSTNTNCGIDVNYVHELQHALRLCGLNELADNFKL